MHPSARLVYYGVVFAWYTFFFYACSYFVANVDESRIAEGKFNPFVGSHWKYLSFLNVVLQVVFYAVSLLTSAFILMKKQRTATFMYHMLKVGVRIAKEALKLLLTSPEGGGLHLKEERSLCAERDKWRKREGGSLQSWRLQLKGGPWQPQKGPSTFSAFFTILSQGFPFSPHSYFPPIQIINSHS